MREIGMVLSLQKRGNIILQMILMTPLLDAGQKHSYFILAGEDCQEGLRIVKNCEKDGASAPSLAQNTCEKWGIRFDTTAVAARP
jgi:hypothetical protein